MNELIQKILYLIPDAKCSVWQKDGKYMGEAEPIDMGEYLLCWNSSNVVPPPTQAQLDAIDIVALNAKKESDRKLARDEKYSKDLSMKAAYRAERKGNPNLTFSQFLDELEQE